MSELPKFKPRRRDAVLAYISQILTQSHLSSKSHLIQLIEYPDGHYRAVFSSRFFILPEGQTQPSKSQWNTLKKKMKRHEPQVFIFKEQGETSCGEDEITSAPTTEDRCCYVDFGFFEH